MSDNTLQPVVIGLAVGVALIAIFIMLSSQLSTQPKEQNIFTPTQTVWVAKNTTQCADPWDTYYDYQTPKGLKPGQKIFEYYFEEKGIKILDSQSLPNPDRSGATCEACGCKSGYTLYLRVNSSDITNMSQYGFIEKQPIS